MRRRLPAWALALGLTVTGALLAGCTDSDAGTGASPGSADSGGSGSDGSAAGGSTADGSATPSDAAYLPVPQGVRLTAQGSELAVRQAATVAWKPDTNRVGVLRIRVQRLERVTLKAFAGWDFDAAARRSTPYYVRARVTNLGRTDLGGVPTPLYIVDGTNTLIQASSFKSAFTPCPSRPLPGRFRPGDRTRVCLVYLSPDKGDLVAVSFRPTQDFDAITWTGEIQRPTPTPTPKPRPRR